MCKLLSCLPRYQSKWSLWTEWTKSQPQRRRAHVELLLESLEHKDVEIRFTNARRLLYILQGLVDCAFPAGTSFIITRDRHIRRNHVTGAPITLDLRKLQGGARREWSE